jgi:hypothetical protein
MSDCPQIVEYWLKKRFFQKRHTWRTAGAFFRADGSLNQLDVPVTPLMQPLIKIGHQLEKNRAFRRLLVELKDFLLYTLVRSIWLCDVAIHQVGGYLCSPRREKIIEVINHAAFVEQLCFSGNTGSTPGASKRSSPNGAV